VGVLRLPSPPARSTAPIETVLHSFNLSDGAEPAAGLIADSSGNPLGTTTFGGASGNGVVFKLTPSGTFTLLYFPWGRRPRV